MSSKCNKLIYSFLEGTKRAVFEGKGIHSSDNTVALILLSILNSGIFKLLEDYFYELW